jgi:hypothetical protein
LRVETGYGFAEGERFVMVEAQALGDRGGPEGEDGGAVDQDIFGGHGG